MQSHYNPLVSGQKLISNVMVGWCIRKGRVKSYSWWMNKKLENPWKVGFGFKILYV
jgi:hypothetical protein